MALGGLTEVLDLLNLNFQKENQISSSTNGLESITKKRCQTKNY